MRPLIDYEIRHNAAHSGEVEQSQSDRRILEARKAALEQEAAKAKTEDNREKARRELAEVNKGSAD
jgi:RNA polymerase-interacting CarD/CdnL/TRCF family regulator